MGNFFTADQYCILNGAPKVTRAGPLAPPQVARSTCDSSCSSRQLNFAGKQDGWRALTGWAAAPHHHPEQLAAPPAGHRRQLQVSCTPLRTNVTGHIWEHLCAFHCALSISIYLYITHVSRVVKHCMHICNFP